MMYNSTTQARRRELQHVFLCDHWQQYCIAFYLPTTSVHFCVLICAPLVPNSFCATVWTTAYPFWPSKKPVPATTASVLSSVELNVVRCPKISYVVSTKSPGKSIITVAWMRYLTPPSTMYWPSNSPTKRSSGRQFW